MNQRVPEEEASRVEAALRAALAPAAAPPLDAGFAARVAARATAVGQASSPAPRSRPSARSPRGWSWAALAAAIVLAVIWGGSRLRNAPAPPVSQAAARRAEQIRQLHYAVALTRAEIASITGEAVRPSLRNLSAQISRSQP